MVFEHKLKSAGKVGIQENESTHRKRDIFMKLEQGPPPTAPSIAPLANPLSVIPGPPGKPTIKSLLTSDYKYKEVQNAFGKTMGAAQILQIEQLNHPAKATIFKFHHQLLLS